MGTKGALWYTHGMNTLALERLRAFRQAIYTTFGCRRNALVEGSGTNKGSSENKLRETKTPCYGWKSSLDDSIIRDRQATVVLGSKVTRYPRRSKRLTSWRSTCCLCNSSKYVAPFSW
jgi:hypothetical protein